MHLFYTFIPVGFEASDYMKMLPLHLQNRLNLYRDNTAKNRSFVAKILLAKAIENQSESGRKETLNGLRYNALGKPELINTPFFVSLSHAGNCVICLVDKKQKVGVDIEQKSRKIEGSRTFFLTERELDEVERQEEKNDYLLQKWVQKEAVSKAIGKGLSADFSTMEQTDNHCFWRGEKFLLKQVAVHAEYYCYVAGTQERIGLEIRHITFENLINTTI